MKPLLILLAALPFAVQADPLAGRNLAATCANCHGSDGRSVPASGMVPLAGMDQASLLRALKEFRDGSRPATVMHQISKGYTEAQLELIARYFSAQK